MLFRRLKILMLTLFRWMKCGILCVDNKKRTFLTDEWEGVFGVLPENRHFFGKDLTYIIEQTNSDIHHRLPRFNRKTKASSRSLI